MKGRLYMTSDNIITELEMARKRDRKIMITNEAIAKVPYIRYKEIPECEYGVLHQLAQDVLTISIEHNHSNEVAITYSLNSKQLAANDMDYIGVSIGDEHSVDPAESAIAYHLLNSSFDCVVVSLHNHPSLSKISLSDVRFFLQYDSVKMMIVVTNLGNISYIVKTSRYNKHKGVELYNKAVNMHYQANVLKGYQKAAEFFLKNCYDANIIYEDR